MNRRISVLLSAAAASAALASATTLSPVGATVLQSAPETVAINDAHWQFTSPVLRGSTINWGFSGGCNVTLSVVVPISSCVVTGTGTASLDALCTQMTLQGSMHVTTYYGVLEQNGIGADSGGTDISFTTILALPPLLNSPLASWTGAVSGTGTPPGASTAQPVGGMLTVDLDNSNPLDLLAGSYDGLCPWYVDGINGVISGELTIQ